MWRPAGNRNRNKQARAFPAGLKVSLKKVALFCAARVRRGGAREPRARAFLNARLKSAHRFRFRLAIQRRKHNFINTKQNTLFFYSKIENKLKKEKTEKREHAAEEHLGTAVRRAAARRSPEHARGHTQGTARTADYSSTY